jgi:hypothetical protein
MSKDISKYVHTSFRFITVMSKDILILVQDHRDRDRGCFKTGTLTKFMYISSRRPHKRHQTQKLNDRPSKRKQQ